jgi:hypothetical protein
MRSTFTTSSCVCASSKSAPQGRRVVLRRRALARDEVWVQQHRQRSRMQHAQPGVLASGRQDLVIKANCNLGLSNGLLSISLVREIPASIKWSRLAGVDPDRLERGCPAIADLKGFPRRNC